MAIISKKKIFLSLKEIDFVLANSAYIPLWNAELCGISSGFEKILHLLCFCSVLCLLCLCARLFKCDLWSPAGKGLTSWLLFVVSNCEFVTFPLVSWVGCGT